MMMMMARNRHRRHLAERAPRSQAIPTYSTVWLSGGGGWVYVFALLLAAPLDVFKIGVFASHLDNRRND